MYQERRATIESLWQSGKTKQKSVHALRERAKDNVLVFIENDGATQIFDRDLSIIRLSAATKCKRPGVTWSRLKIAVNALDRQGLNTEVIERLNKGDTVQQVTDVVFQKLKDEIGF